MIVGVIDVASLGAAIAAVLTALATLVATLRNGHRIQAVRQEVNGRTDHLLDRVSLLSEELSHGGQAVPVDHAMEGRLEARRIAVAEAGRLNPPPVA